MVDISGHDTEWLSIEQPEMLKQNNTIQGTISFSMLYNQISGRYILNANARPKPYEIYHEDDYRILIDLDVASPYPTVREISNKVLTTQKRMGRTKGDMHINSDDTFCLEAPQELDKEFSDTFTLSAYMNRYVIPFLFEQTHMRLTGYWAWKPLPHGQAGPLEWHYLKANEGSIEDSILTIHAVSTTGIEANKFLDRLVTNQIHRNSPCFCGSGERVILCCPQAMYGYKKLRKIFVKMDPDDFNKIMVNLNDTKSEPAHMSVSDIIGRS